MDRFILQDMRSAIRLCRFLLQLFAIAIIPGLCWWVQVAITETSAKIDGEDGDGEDGDDDDDEHRLVMKMVTMMMVVMMILMMVMVMVTMMTYIRV